VRFAIISDIHANKEALDAVIDSIKHQLPDQIICLGDIVGYGADPNYCVDVVRQMADISIIGNHDHAALGLTSTYTFNIYAREAADWTASRLTPDNIAYLESLKLTHSQDNMLFVHSSPYKPETWGYILSDFEAEWNFEYLDEKLCFIGHSHLPDEFKDEFTGKRIINVGSVGQPRDDDPRSCYYLYDSLIEKGRWIRTEYPFQITAKKILKAGLPRILAERLAMGR